MHALHPDEKTPVILRVFYVRPGMLKVGVEAVWRVARSDGDAEGPVNNGGEKDGEEVLRSADEGRELPRLLSGWDNDMPAVSYHQGKCPEDGRVVGSSPPLLTPVSP